MDAAWVGVIGGAVGGGIATFASLGAVQLQARNARIAEHEQARRAACTDLLVSSASLLNFASALHSTMETRSGLGEGLNVAVGARAVGDVFEFYEKVRPDIEAMHRAVGIIWMLESQQVIEAANRVNVLAMSVIGAATVRGDARSAVTRFLLGEKWTDEQLDEWNRQRSALAEARRDFNCVVRNRLGQNDVVNRTGFVGDSLGWFLMPRWAETGDGSSCLRLRSG